MGVKPPVRVGVYKTCAVGCKVSATFAGFLVVSDSAIVSNLHHGSHNLMPFSTAHKHKPEPIKQLTNNKPIPHPLHILPQSKRPPHCPQTPRPSQTLSNPVKLIEIPLREPSLDALVRIRRKRQLLELATQAKARIHALAHRAPLALDAQDLWRFAHADRGAADVHEHLQLLREARVRAGDCAGIVGY